MTATIEKPHLDEGILTDEEYSHLLSKLLEARRLCPNIRMGQFLCNMATLARGPEDPGAVWEMEDRELLEAVNEQIDNYIAMGREPIIV